MSWHQLVPLEVTSIVDPSVPVGAMQAALPIVLGIVGLFILVSVAGAVFSVVTRSLTK